MSFSTIKQDVSFSPVAHITTYKSEEPPPVTKLLHPLSKKWEPSSLAKVTVERVSLPESGSVRQNELNRFNLVKFGSHFFCYSLVPYESMIDEHMLCTLMYDAQPRSPTIFLSRSLTSRKSF